MAELKDAFQRPTLWFVDGSTMAISPSDVGCCVALAGIWITTVGPEEEGLIVYKGSVETAW